MKDSEKEAVRQQGEGNMAATILETIAAYAKERAAKDKENVPEAVMKERALALPKGTFRFSQALKKKEMAFICEVKKASPSKGLDRSGI